ncbi:hypothetical protein QR680_018131 [Steinernema hermaphroditum]|uniref:Uncharacterized protein n=1 Tax=Steinernema hermaphroditum TaxID=289476 RepID=A0AA39LQ87_9BILA|nr:hypothetical protein QR680_018131 [Steinernema hermaphroditum]
MAPVHNHSLQGTPAVLSHWKLSDSRRRPIFSDPNLPTIPQIPSPLNQIEMAIEVQQIIELILCIILPPLAIFIHTTECNIHVAVNIVLCIFFWVPAIIHALWYCFFRV